MDDRIANGCWTATVRGKLDRNFGKVALGGKHTPSQRLLGNLLREHCDCGVEIVLFDHDQKSQVARERSESTDDLGYGRP